jgi:hypothetical protein
VIIAVVIKLSLFVFAAMNAPQGKMLPDSYGYLNLSKILASEGVFASQDGNGRFIYETLRTPGYPLFLAAFHGLMKIPLDGVVLIQIAMTLLAAFITYKTAMIIEPKIAFLSAVIILYDPPITIFSLTILTESLFLLLISLFMFFFVLYMKSKKAGHLILSAFLLAVAAYVRPVAYYLGFGLFFFIFYLTRREAFKRVFTHALIFVLVVYGLLGVWQIRNHARCHNSVFTSVEKENSVKGLFKSYVRNTDPYTKGMAPIPYYANVSARCLMSLMTRPGNLKYFKSHTLTVIGKVLAYPWMAFWLVGFIWGIIKARDSIYMQFILFIIAYFIAASIFALMWDVSERLRVPMMPFIAIISAYGWVSLRGLRLLKYE